MWILVVVTFLIGNPVIVATYQLPVETKGLCEQGIKSASRQSDEKHLVRAYCFDSKLVEVKR